MCCPAASGSLLRGDCLNSIYVSPVSEFCVFLPVRQDVLSAMCLEWKGSAVSLLVGVENDP